MSTTPDTAAPFNDRAATAGYADRARRLVPGMDDMQRMAGVLLAERAPADGHILVVGAGGGAEIATFARLQPQWRFTGVDPAAPMLDLARETLGAAMSRVALHEGYVDTAPEGPFDGATCILTLHFVEHVERARTLTEIRRRLKPDAPFVMAHISFPMGSAEERERWLSRYVAFAISSGVDADSVRNAATAIGEKLPLLSPEAEEAMLREAGFTDVQPFYQGFSFRGWVAYA